MTSGDTKFFAVDRALGRTVEGRALVTTAPFSARYDLDFDRGVFSRLGHPLDGEPVAEAILICPGVRGGIAGGWAFLKLASQGLGFAGLVFERVNPVLVQGAQAAELSIAAGVDPAIFVHARSGVTVRLDPAALQVSLLRESADR
jgi:predicted aconitase with swiveling domain